MHTVLLDTAIHNRKRFDCGVDALNNYLRVTANQQARKDNSRTFVLTNTIESEHIIGYYSLTMATLDLGQLPAKLQKRHRDARSGGLIARLAVDKHHTSQGYGEWLLIDALTKLLDANQTVAFPIVLVDAKPGAAAFYEKFGFTAFNDSTDKLFMTMADIRANITK